jgi:hypothetical protein
VTGGITRAHAVFPFSGPVVRINPDELHIDDIDYYDTVYALNKKRNKDPYHVQIFGTPLSRKFRGHFDLHPFHCSDMVNK